MNINPKLGEFDEKETKRIHASFSNGFSKGKWEGSTLVIKTNMLEKTIRVFEETDLRECHNRRKIFLDEDGQTLNAIIIVHDEENYKKLQ